ncbi:MAG: cardiolipin synthase [Saprospiraceae bacterium]|nr:cardiolipin synthase [Saprospiraceae bacterium]
MVIILIISYIILVILLVSNLLYSGQRPPKTLAWILVILFLPIIGILLYITFGVNRRRFKFFNIKASRKALKHLERANKFFADLENGESELLCTTPKSKALEAVNCHSSRFKATSGNDVQILYDGHETYEAIFEAMESAEKFIHVQYYIFEEGKTADRFASIFESKIKKGVQVRLMYDGLGSMTLDKKFIKRLRGMGVETQSYFPLYINRPFKWQINYRNHRKIVVVDGKVGFTGGMNISDKYIDNDSSELGRWHDHHVKIAGPSVWSLNTVFTIDWHFATGKEDVLDRKYFPKVNNIGPDIVQIVSSGPDSEYPAIEYQYLTMIHNAREYLYIINPYVIPDLSVLSALKVAAMSGVDVRILFPQKSDSKIVHWSMHSYFEELLSCGVQLYQFTSGFIHSKIMISDDEYASVGTANLDVRSFYQNSEINAVIYSTDKTVNLAEQFRTLLHNSSRLELETFKNLSFSKRFTYRACRILSPLL